MTWKEIETKKVGDCVYERTESMAYGPGVIVRSIIIDRRGTTQSMVFVPCR